MFDFLLLGEINAFAILITCIIGAICGFLAGQIMKGHGFGLIGNMIVGILGAALFGWLFGSFGLIAGSPFLNEVIGGTLGAMILLFVIQLITKK